MKSKIIFAAFLVLLIVALAGVSQVLATANYDVYLSASPKQNGVIVFTFPTAGVDWDFSGKNIREMILTYWHYTSSGFVSYDLTPYATQIHYTTKSVDLIFKDFSLPWDSDLQDFTTISGTIQGGDTFFGYGPGLTYIHF